MTFLNLNQTSDNVLYLPESLWILLGLAVVAFWVAWYVATCAIRDGQNEFRKEMLWRLDAIIEALKKKE